MKGKDIEFKWTDVERNSFLDIKSSMMTAPVLRRPDFDKEFILETAASKYALGAILGQSDVTCDPTTGRKTAQPYVIAYASKNTTKPEQNYSINELECLAVVWGVKLFRPYLIGRRFKVVTDHHALIWLMNTKDLTGLARWSLKLQEYDFDIVYRKGKEHGNVDALRRLGYMDKHLQATQIWRSETSDAKDQVREEGDTYYDTVDTYKFQPIEDEDHETSSGYDAQCPTIYVTYAWPNTLDTIEHTYITMEHQFEEMYILNEEDVHFHLPLVKIPRNHMRISRRQQNRHL